MKMTAMKALGLGWSIIPVKADKKPYFGWTEYQSIKPNRDMLADWHRKYKPPAWAAITGKISGLVVLDLDGVAGLETMARLGLDPHVLTGSGGRHVYFEYPGFEVKTINGKSKQELGRLYPGLDIRADGGYSVCCGSNRSGNYTWLRDPVLCSTSVLPTDLRSLLGLEMRTAERSTPVHSRGADEMLAEALEASVSGRNEAGFRLACRLRDSGYTKHEARTLLLSYQSGVGAVNSKGQLEPYTADEALASLNQAYNSVVVVSRGVRHGAAADADDDAPLKVMARPWPDPLQPVAYHGLAGDVVRVVGPHSEADPAALLFSFIVAFGSVAGRNGHFIVESDSHYGNLFTVLVGMSAKGRKGTSLSQIRGLFRQIDPDWELERIQSGLSSGEGLIWAVRDPITREEPLREGKAVTGYQTVVMDHGIEDKRLLIVEGEFSSTLKVLAREGNTLSAVIRNAWDTGNLRTLTKSTPARATGAHISIITHITKDEILCSFDGSEAGNGFGNRFLWVSVKRSKLLPEGGRVPDQEFSALVDRIRLAVESAQLANEMVRDQDARELWRQVYPKLSAGKPGLLGAVTGRAEAQVMRIACVYALLDCTSTIGRDHLEAALAVWHYAEQSAEFIFGDSLGDPVADELLRALKSDPAGMTRTDINHHFGRNKSSRELGRALGVLLEYGLIRGVHENSPGGGVCQRWTLATLPAAVGADYELNETNEPECALPDVNSSNSLDSSAYTAENTQAEGDFEEGVI